MGRSRDEDRLPTLDELEAAVDDRRFVDICIQFRERVEGDAKDKASGPVMLEVGGRWDRIEQRYLEGVETDSVRVIPVNPSQIQFVRWAAEWIRRRRLGEYVEPVAFLGGARRGGKTFIGLLFVVAVAIDQPGAITWLVSKHYKERDELERLVRDWVPRSWRTYRGMPDYRFTLINGSTVESVSGDEPDALKRGKADAVAFNEAQKMDQQVAEYGIPSVIDRRGIAVFMANPPSNPLRGAWCVDFRQALIDGVIAGRSFDVDPAKNPSIDQRVRGDVAKMLHLLNPKTGGADADGEWVHFGDLAFPQFIKKPLERGGHIGVVPDLGFTDITAETVRARTGRAEDRYEFVAGADFQDRPHQATVVARVLRGADGRVYYWLTDEILIEGTEDLIADKLTSRGYDPKSLLIVGDASGKWQNSSHDKTRPYSWQILGSHGWNVVAPRKSANPDATKHGVGRNPDVDDSLMQMYDVMAAGRLLVDPRCEWLIESLAKCPLRRVQGRKKIDDKGGYSHISDCVRYLVWYLEPRKAPPRRAVEDSTRKPVMPRRM